MIELPAALAVLIAHGVMGGFMWIWEAAAVQHGVNQLTLPGLQQLQSTEPSSIRINQDQPGSTTFN
jgi:hypothetical protein